MDISARAFSLADRPQRAIRVTSVRIRREDRSCACRKSNPDILVVQPTQDRTAENASSGEGVGEVAFDHVIMADERITMSGCGRAA